MTVMELSIIIITRNRKHELMRALQSCIECVLPAGTEFVVVDNASADGTKEEVERFFQNNPHAFQYRYLPENTGAAAGRNVGYKMATGRYVYFLDDDAYIDNPKQTFFPCMIAYLEENPEIFGITTTIYDTEIEGDRWLIRKKGLLQDTCRRVLWFHCGSVLMDRERSYDQDALFLQYLFKGMPELYPSLRSYFQGKYIVEMDRNRVIHEPSLHTRPSKKNEAIYHYTGGMHARLVFYPLAVYPLLYLLFCLRIIKHLGLGGLPDAFRALAQLNKSLVREPTSLRNIVSLLNDFGFVAIF